MSKRYNISWNENQNEQLRKAVKNFNAKISRIEKKNPELKKLLPDKVTVKEMKDLIRTRQDLQREVNALKRFTDKSNVIRKNEDGSYTGIVEIPENKYNLKVTEWQFKDMKRRANNINRKRQERREMIADIEMTDRGKKVGYTKGDFGMGKIDEVSLEPIKPFTPSQTRADLNAKYETLMNESQSSYWNLRELTMMNSFKTALIENYNPEDVQDVLNAIDDMGFEEFYKIYQAEGGNFEFAYPPSEEQYEEYLTALKSAWLPQT